MQIYVRKIIIKLNGILHKTAQFTVMTEYIPPYLIVPILTTQACKATFYWMGLTAIFSIFAPSNSNFIYSAAI